MPYALASAGQLTAWSSQFYAERGCMPLRIAALFDSSAANDPASYRNCPLERVRLPLPRPYAISLKIDASTGAALLNGGSEPMRASLHAEPYGGLTRYFVRIEASEAAATSAMAKCLEARTAVQSATFMHRCRMPAPGVFDLLVPVVDR